MSPCMKIYERQDMEGNELTITDEGPYLMARATSSETGERVWVDLDPVDVREIRDALNTWLEGRP